MKKQIYSVAMYLRLSRDDEDIDGSVKTESNSINSQREIIRAYVREQDDLELYDIYIDDGFSRSNFERPDFKRMMKDIEDGKVNCVIVKDFSRFGRDYIEAGQLIQKTFPALSVRFIALTDRYDSLTADSNDSAIVLPIKNFINDSYCRDSSVRVKSHQKARREKGDCISSFVVYGYRKNEKKKGTLLIDEYAADVVRRIFRWKIEGYSNYAIVQKLNGLGIQSPMEYKRSKGENFHSGFAGKKKTGWSATAVKRILTNEVYLGHMIQGKRERINYKVNKIVEKPEHEWVRVENCHQAIIIEDDFEIVQRLLAVDGRVSKNYEQNFFMGILFCGDCKEQMVKRVNDYKGKKTERYICSTKNRGEGCSRHSISVETLKKIVFTAVHKYAETFLEQYELLDKFKDMEVDFTVVDQYDKEVQRLQEERKKYETLRGGLDEDLKKGILEREDFLLFKNAYEQSIKSLNDAISNQKKLLHVMFQNGVLAGKRIEKLKAATELADLELDRYTLVSLVKAIYVYEDKRVEVQFNFADEFETLLQMNKEITYRLNSPQVMRRVQYV